MPDARRNIGMQNIVRSEGAESLRSDLTEVVDRRVSVSSKTVSACLRSLDGQGYQMDIEFAIRNKHISQSPSLSKFFTR